MFGKGINDPATGNVPSQTGGITRRRQDFFLAQESAARQESVVAGHFDRRVVAAAAVDLVDGAQIVESTAADQVALGLFDADGHDVAGFQGNGLELVGRDGVPYQQIAVLGGTHDAAGITRPVQSGNLAKVSLQDAACLDGGRGTERSEVGCRAGGGLGHGRVLLLGEGGVDGGIELGDLQGWKGTLNGGDV